MVPTSVEGVFTIADGATVSISTVANTAKACPVSLSYAGQLNVLGTLNVSTGTKELHQWFIIVGDFRESYL